MPVNAYLISNQKNPFIAVPRSKELLEKLARKTQISKRNNISAGAFPISCKLLLTSYSRGILEGWEIRPFSLLTPQFHHSIIPTFLPPNRYRRWFFGEGATGLSGFIMLFCLGSGVLVRKKAFVANMVFVSGAHQAAHIPDIMPERSSAVLAHFVLVFFFFFFHFSVPPVVV
jgi:hypothetical protein